MSTPRIFQAIAIAGLLAPLAACTSSLDLHKDIAIVDVTSGWYDAGIIKDAEGEKNKLVPAISFRLKNTTADKPIRGVQINAVYHLVNEKDKEWGTTWVYGIGSEGLKPGATTQPLVLRGDRAYTGLEPRLQMLQNSHFVDAVVDLMAKYDAQQWTTLGTYPITRQLLEHERGQ